MEQTLVNQSKFLFRKSLLGITGLCLAGLVACAGGGDGPAPVPPARLKLPAGFKAVAVVENFGEVRHIAVTPNGVIYVKLMHLKNGKGIYRLQDTNGDGVADKITGFGNYAGTGMAIRDGYLYASSDEEVFRYKLDGDGNVATPDQPEKIVTGLISRGEHEPKGITLDYSGNLYVNIGAYSNACQLKDRAKGSPGQQPCPILDSAGGIWQFRADVPNQTYGGDHHYATGLRNVVGFDWNQQTNSLFVMQHGRDQLSSLYPEYWNDKQSAELPAECLYELHKGSNCGWPYIFYDEFQHKQVLGPEYGGDGKKDPPQQYQDPVLAFPGHLAPDGLLFYTGDQFPARYKNGAFVAFHGSWNRAPEPQAGFFVVFVPFENGKPTGKWEIFADNFAGGPEKMSPSKADHRPCGLAQGPDGSIYVTDDNKNGGVWKISYNK
jgi:glucose/arabinose dehydrogenase